MFSKASHLPEIHMLTKIKKTVLIVFFAILVFNLARLNE